MEKRKQSMKAILVRNKNLVLENVPLPSPKQDEVLIQVKAAGVNRPDIFQREGHYPPPPGASDILGLEVAGIIEETGEEICALLSGGGYAEYVCTPRSQCLPLPQGLSFEEASVLPECVFTIWKNVFQHGAFQADETVLVHGGTSGIGTTAIQMIKVFDGQVIVTCGTDEKCQAALDLGADLAINYNKENFVDSVLNYTTNRGVNLVLDMVGGDYVARNLACLGENGRHISIAFLHGAKTEILIPKIMEKRLQLTGSMLRSRPTDEKAALTKEILAHVWPRIENDQIKPVIFKTFPLQEAAKAHKALESGDHIGKIVLKV